LRNDIRLANPSVEVAHGSYARIANPVLYGDIFPMLARIPPSPNVVCLVVVQFGIASALRIYAVWNRLKMIGVYAGWDSAKMVKVKILGDGSAMAFIHHSVSQARAPVLTVTRSITMLLLRVLPYPARRRYI
jgi:hypothetical protein